MEVTFTGTDDNDQRQCHLMSTFFLEMLRTVASPGTFAMTAVSFCRCLYEETSARYRPDMIFLLIPQRWGTCDDMQYASECSNFNGLPGHFRRRRKNFFDHFFARPGRPGRILKCFFKIKPCLLNPKKKKKPLCRICDSHRVENSCSPRGGEDLLVDSVFSSASFKNHNWAPQEWSAMSVHIPPLQEGPTKHTQTTTTTPSAV